MSYEPEYRVEPNELLLDIKRADVNGDNIIDNVSLIGSGNNLIINNIRIRIHDEKNNIDKTIPLKVDRGYEPRLFLGDFNQDDVSDILVSIQSGNTGREGYFYIYSFIDNIARLLFDYEEFNNEYMYDVIYKDNYVVTITSRNDGRQYIINISNRSKEYLSKIYNDNGTLKRELKGMVSPIIELRPAFNQNKEGYHITAIQRIIGYYNADTLGMMETSLRWNGSHFVNINAPKLILFGSNTNIK